MGLGKKSFIFFFLFLNVLNVGISFLYSEEVEGAVLNCYHFLLVLVKCTIN